MRVLRLDKIHPLLSGNKWFKLKYNLLEFQQRQGAASIELRRGLFESPLTRWRLRASSWAANYRHGARGDARAIELRTDFAAEQGMRLVPLSRERL